MVVAVGDEIDRLPSARGCLLLAALVEHEDGGEEMTRTKTGSFPSIFGSVFGRICCRDGSCDVAGDGSGEVDECIGVQSPDLDETRRLAREEALMVHMRMGFTGRLGEVEVE